jgi:hypothetical protein
MLKEPTVTTITSGNFSFLYSPDVGKSMLFDLSIDPEQENNIIHKRSDVAEELHQCLVRFMRDTNVADYLLAPRLALRL